MSDPALRIDVVEGQLAECAAQLGEAQKEIARLSKVNTELQAQRDGLRRRKSEDDRQFEMYVNAWVRELGGRTIPKSHQIDSLVLTTRLVYLQRNLYLETLKMISIAMNASDARNAAAAALRKEVL